MRRNHAHQGFSLVELMIVIAISAILLGLASSNWSVVIDRFSASTTGNAIRSVFYFARQNAVFNQSMVTICPLDSNLKCSSDWNSPVSVFVDTANQKRLINSDDLLRVFTIVNRGQLLSSAVGHGRRRYFQYKPDGSMHGSIGNLTWCPPNADPRSAFQVRVNFGGRIRWARDSDGDGVPEDSSGQPIRC